MPIYMFACSTNSRQYVNIEVRDPPLQFTVPFRGAQLTMKLYLWGTPSFNVEVTTETADDDIAEIADIITHVLSGLYDSMGLLTGQPQQVSVDGFYVVGTRNFAQINYGLPKFDVEMGQAGLTLNDWATLAVGSPQLRAALRDLRLAMQTPGEATVHCFRSIERIRQAFSGPGSDRKKTWWQLAEALNLHRSWLDSYTAHAIAVRHGEIVELQLDDRNRCLAQAATVVIRYASYLKGGRINLLAATFPRLENN